MIVSLVHVLMLVLNISFMFVIYGLVKYSYRMSLIMINLEDALSESIDILEARHMDLTKISELDIFFDSQEVRDAMRCISDSRDAVHYVATSILGAIDEENVVSDEDEQ